LFLYINRTDYDREEGQATKNQHKFTFDFTFYLDRYLERYRKEDDLSNEKIKELLVTKNKLKEQINSLKILFKKIEECQKYAQELEGWGDKLPKEEEFEEEYTTLEDKLASVEKELDDIESRN
jgi:predicted  nucleic acid-binding Zn-ribbon protein